MAEPQYSLEQFDDEEGKVVLEAHNQFLRDHNAYLKITPFLNENGTIGAAAQLWKKIELVPKAPEGATSENGENSTDKTSEPEEVAQEAANG